MSVPTSGYEPQTCVYNVQGSKSGASLGIDISVWLDPNASNNDDLLSYGEAAAYAIADAASADSYVVNIVQRTFAGGTRNEQLPYPPS